MYISNYNLNVTCTFQTVFDKSLSTSDNIKNHLNKNFPSEKISTLNKQYSNKSTPEKKELTLMELKEIVMKSSVHKNVLVFYNILSEILLVMSGEMSNKLLVGAKHVFCVHMQTLRENSTKFELDKMGLKIKLVRAYIFLFSRLFKKLITIINKRWNINLKENMYVINTNKNLEHFIELQTKILDTNFDLKYINSIPDEFESLNDVTIDHDSLKSENEYFATPVIEFSNMIKLLENTNV